MLIFKRNVGEAFQIGDNVCVRILGSRGKAVRIAIEAPKDIPVHREEIYKRIKQEEKLRASGGE